MLTVTAEHVFALPIDDLWAILGDFGQTGKWSGRPPEACVREGSGIGAIRTLTIQDGRVIVDRLDAQSDYSYKYSIISGPLPYASYTATMAVEAIDATQSLFRWTGNFTPKGISEDDAIALTRRIYADGIAMMRQTIEGS